MPPLDLAAIPPFSLNMQTKKTLDYSSFIDMNFQGFLANTNITRKAAPSSEISGIGEHGGLGNDLMHENSVPAEQAPSTDLNPEQSDTVTGRNSRQSWPVKEEMSQRHNLKDSRSAADQFSQITDVEEAVPIASVKRNTGEQQQFRMHFIRSLGRRHIHPAREAGSVRNNGSPGDNNRPDQELQQSLIFQQDRLLSPNQENPFLYRRVENEIRRYQEKIKQSEHDLREERALVEQLKEDIRAQEEIISKAHTNAINLLSQDVSVSFPDDWARRKFQFLFDQDTFNWCMEYSKGQKMDLLGHVDMLVKNGILADTVDVPVQLRIDLQNETTPAIILQAALARTLCDLFLKSPFFLQEWLPSLDTDALKECRADFLTTWRARTVEFLETAFPATTCFFDRRAQQFVEEYGFLLGELDENALPDLAELMEQFSKLAIQLWKRNVLVQVEGLEQPDLTHFCCTQPDVEVEPTVLAGVGAARLDGRPVQVMVRPRIVSLPVHKGGHVAGKVVWSSAVVWVSNA